MAISIPNKKQKEYDFMLLDNSEVGDKDLFCSLKHFDLSKIDLIYYLCEKDSEYHYQPLTGNLGYIKYNKDTLKKEIEDLLTIHEII